MTHGLNMQELEAQGAELLPDRVEMTWWKSYVNVTRQRAIAVGGAGGAGGDGGAGGLGINALNINLLGEQSNSAGNGGAGGAGGAGGGATAFNFND